MASEPFDYAKLAGLFGSPWHRNYVKSKLRTDPLYNGVFGELDGAELPLLDLGCDLGLLYLRRWSCMMRQVR